MSDSTKNPDSNPKVRVLQALSSIPSGKVCSYGQLAQLAGLGAAARYVGTCLRNLPHDTKLPWHRVVNSQGRLSLPMDSPSYQLQKRRLENEGVVFTRGKIALDQFGAFSE